jgi:hypothetical protein
MGRRGRRYGLCAQREELQVSATATAGWRGWLPGWLDPSLLLFAPCSLPDIRPCTAHRHRWEIVKNRPHLVSICGSAAGVAQPASYGHILLEKTESKHEADPRPNGLLSGTEWTSGEDNLLREAVRACEVDGAVTSWSRVAQLVGNNRTAQPCRGRWRRLKKNDDKLGLTHEPSAEAQATIRSLAAQLDGMDESERAIMDAAARGKKVESTEEETDETSSSSQKQEEVMMDRPGWTAAWSYEHNAWYWWNAKHETTWDDPADGEPTLVPSEPVPQSREEDYMNEMPMDDEEDEMDQEDGGYAEGGGAPGLLPLSEKVLAKLKKDPNAPKRPVRAPLLCLPFPRMRATSCLPSSPPPPSVAEMHRSRCCYFFLPPPPPVPPMINY